MNKWFLISYLCCFGASVITSDSSMINLIKLTDEYPTHFVKLSTIECLADYCSSVRSGINNFDPAKHDLSSVGTDLNTVTQHLPEAHNFYLNQTDFASNPSNTLGTVVGALIKYNITLACNDGCALYMNPRLLEPCQKSGCSIQ